MHVRRRHYREMPDGRVALTPRDKAILLSVFTYRFLRTPHIMALVSGGPAIAELVAGAQGTIIAGPEIVAEESHWKVEVAGTLGWVAAECLTQQGSGQPLTARTPLGATVQTTKATYVRTRPGGGERRVRERLRDLFDHRLLSRVDEPVIDYDEPGSESIIYALNNAGADVLADTFGLSRGTIDWQAKNKELVSKPNIYHTLAVAEVMVKFVADCRERGDTHLLQQWDVVKGTPRASEQGADRYGWNVTVRATVRDHKTKQQMEREVSFGVRPDRIVGIDLLTRDGQSRRWRYFLEADLGTMPVQWRGLRQSSIGKKIIGYSETYKQSMHETLYRWRRFRVLFVTTSQQRVDTMLAYVAKVAAERGYRSDLFLFTDYATLAQHNIFDVRWRSIRNGAEAQTTLLGE